MDKAKAHLKRNWKRYALLAIGAGAASQGVPPEAAQGAATVAWGWLVETLAPVLLK